jgi:hypothetical protein
MDWYDSFVEAQPILSSMLLFAILGTVGEILGFWIRRGKGWPFPPLVILGKMLGWALLGILMKYAFIGFRGFVATLYEHEMLPWGEELVVRAFFVSFWLNILFGPFVYATHCLLDNLIERKWDWAGLLPAMTSLLWFWIPAHTLTFSLQVDYQIGLAAVWSATLGIILGFLQRLKKPAVA